jgi:hypothetical protein
MENSKNLIKLTEKVEKMLLSEKKRREITIKWISEVEKILLKIAIDIFPTTDIKTCVNDDTIRLTKINSNGNKSATNVYLRYNNSSQYEIDGIYYLDVFESENIDGTHYSDLKGKNLYYVLDIIINYIPQLCDNIDKKNDSRNELLKEINILYIYLFM